MAALKATTSNGTSLGNSESALGLSRAAKAGTAKRACFSRACVAMQASAKAFGGTASPVYSQAVTRSGVITCQTLRCNNQGARTCLHTCCSSGNHHTQACGALSVQLLRCPRTDCLVDA